MEDDASGTLLRELTTSSTKLRTASLNALSEQIRKEEVSLDELPLLLKLLFQSHTYFIDRPSRKCVRKCLSALYTSPIYSDRCIKSVVAALKRESEKVDIAASNAFVLLEWISELLPETCKTPASVDAYLKDSLNAMVSLLDICVGSSQGKGSLKLQALKVSRRALRSVFKAEYSEGILCIVVDQLTAKDSPRKNAILLGVVGGVCARLTKPKEVLSGLQSQVFQFYTKEFLGSRTVVPRHLSDSLHDFFVDFTTSENFEIELAAPVERSLLRSPELVLNNVVTPLFKSLPTNLDISEPLESRILKQLLSCVKSANVSIRNGAVTAYEASILRCHEQSAVDRMAREILGPLKTGKLSSADQRQLHAKMLSATPPSESLAVEISTGLSAMVIKEPNEHAVGQISLAIVTHLSAALRMGIEVEKIVSDTICKGLKDKRPAIKRLWFLRVGSMIWHFGEEVADPTRPARRFCSSLVGALLEGWSEVVANPIAASQHGAASAAYITTAVLLGKLRNWKDPVIQAQCKKIDFLNQCLTTQPKMSFLLNSKIYTKMTSDEDGTWVVRALESVANFIVDGKDHAELWSLSMLFFICSSIVPPDVNKAALSSLTTAYLRRSEVIGKIVVNGIWQWLRKVEETSPDRDSPALLAKTGASRIRKALSAISVPASTASGGLQIGNVIDEEVVKNQLVSLTVISHHTLLYGVSWIALCQRSGIDPGELVSERAHKLINEIKFYTGLAGRSISIKQAAIQCSATLAFVAPDVITPLVVKLLEGDLDPKLLEGIGPTEVAIWRTPFGIPFVDVLAKSSDHQVNLKTKDADTLRWEAELRAQLEEKRGKDRKLTADEKARVDEQLAKETVIRKKVYDVDVRLSRGVGIVQALAKGALNGVEMWMGHAIDNLLRVLEAGAGLVVGDRGIKALLACAEHVSPRLGLLRPFLGLAVLRAHGVSEISSTLLEEPLGALTKRLLYRLRSTAEQRPFDPVSLFYILPLVGLVLEHGGVGVNTGEEIDEQVLLALMFLSFHTDTCSNTHLPRGKILKVLIHSLQTYVAHFKSVRDCFSDLCRCISPSISIEETEILIDGTISVDVNVRATTLQAIDSDIDLSDLAFSSKIWIACHDEVEENVELARSIWDESAMAVDDSVAIQMVPYLDKQDKQLRGATARALAEAVQLHPKTFSNVLESLINLYKEKAKPILPTRDEFGMLKKIDTKDPWEARSGIALTWKELAPLFNESNLIEFCRFLIDGGALADKHDGVREEVIEAASYIITYKGGNHLEELMEAFETTLEAPDDGSDSRDRINEAVIILYGALGRHLKSGDERISKVIDRLLASLAIPSESVQYAVAECLPPLIRASRDQTGPYIKLMQDQLLSSKGYASRRGAAYGIAGIVKGFGISALKDFRLMSALKAATEDKKNFNGRQGALFAFELLSLILGRVYEPYVIQILPLLLQCFGDPNADVRDACSDAAKVCFSSLSSYGVKVILPDLLEGLEDPAWRSKKGACETLGAMAYLAPHQLAISLPEIIPPLTTVLNDSHKEVRASANRSLKKFGEVINNPEIKELTSILLKALSDPTKYTEDALDSLIKVSFVHYLDSPSLALVTRILERGLGERSVLKRKASQIIGSLAHLTERKDLMVHIPVLVCGLKQAIVDPVPATRATASKALGSLIEKLGEDSLPDIIPGLMTTLKSDTGAGDRLGSAQALSEVLSGLGTQRLEETLPTILQNASSSRPAVREGFMSLFIYLPACFGNSFSAYLNRIIPPILAGLADDVESIRETSLRAGRLLVKNFATRAIDLLLPELERGLADANYRIRLSSVELVGDLLFNLTGISGKNEQDELEGGAEVSSSLLEVLGQERRDKVLSALYICRCDTSGQVRLAAVGVWKALVSSPRTLKELVPTLTQLIIRRLASSNLEQRVIAGQALGELIRKAGDGVLSTLLPTLDEGLRTATDADAKQGICMALKELVTSTAPEALEECEATLVSIVRSALVDSDFEVREAAAEAFDALQKIIGKRAVDQVLPHLLNLLQSYEEADNALAALLTLLTEQTRSNIILPVLIPNLLSPPITAFNAKALASLSEVAGTALNRRLPKIINALVDAIVTSEDPLLTQELNNSLNAVILSVDEFDGLNTMMVEMLKLVKDDDHKKRAVACTHLAKAFAELELDYSRYTQDCIRVLLASFDDRDRDVVKAAWTAQNELTKTLKKEEMESIVVSTRQVLLQVGIAGHPLPGFLLPKGINSILPIFLQGLMYGTPDQRTQAALAISDIIDRSNADALRPYVTHITGPLIRVVSERSVDVKAAILLTLNNLLQKIPVFLKPFLPQLQRTFAKSLADTSSELLRSRAAKALGTLITLTPRIDPLISELTSGAKTTDSGVKDAMLKALYEVVSKAGANMGEPSKASTLALIEDVHDGDNDQITITGARLLGALVRHLSREDAARTIRNHALNPISSRFSVLALNAVLKESPSALEDIGFARETPASISQGILKKNPFVSDNCVLAAGKYLLSEAVSKNFDSTKVLLEALVQAISGSASGSSDTKRLALVVVRTVSRLHYELVRPHLQILAPAVFSCVRDIVIPIKLAAEQAFIALFQVTLQGDKIFEKYIVTVDGTQKRSMNDYFRRVALKLAAAEKERNEAGGAGVGLNSDEKEDLREIESVGKVDLESDGWIGG